MAAPITHIVLADKIFNNFFAGRDKQRFFIGTCFPDIRYPQNLDRNTTHTKEVLLSDLGKSDDFKAGFGFHSLVDWNRQAFLRKHNVYDLCPKSEHISQSLKILEDIVLYESIIDWNKYVDYLNRVMPEELAMGVTQAGVEEWHRILQDYLKQAPTDQSIRDFHLAIGWSVEMVDEVIINLRLMQKDPKILGAIRGLYDNTNLWIV